MNFFTSKEPGAWHSLLGEAAVAADLISSLNCSGLKFLVVLAANKNLNPQTLYEKWYSVQSPTVAAGIAKAWKCGPRAGPGQRVE